MKIIAEFDKPYDAMLIMLKDELQANSIEYKVTGENGHDIQYNAFNFEIQVLVTEKDFTAAAAIFNDLKRQNRSDC